MLELVKLWYNKVNHYFNPHKCGEDTFWFYDVLFCNKCNRSLAYYTYEITDDGEDIKKFIIKKPFKNLFKDK